MARPTKKGVDYFPFDVGFFGDKNVRILKARYRADGIAVYVKILCDVYKEGYYLPVVDWEDYVFVIADEFGISTNAVEQVIAFLQSHAMVRVFKKKDELTGLDVDAVITSHGIQKRYAAAMKSRRKKSVDEIKRGFWLLTEDEENEINAFYKNGINDSLSKNNPEETDSLSKNNPNKSEKNSVKEKKGNSTSPFRNRTCTCTDEQKAREELEAKTRFFDLYPALLKTAQGVDDSGISYILLLEWFARSKKHLQSAWSFPWIISVYSDIIAGKYDDKQGTTSKDNRASTSPTLPPAVQAANAIAERKRFYEIRQNESEKEASKRLEKALKLSVEFACATDELMKMQVHLGKAEFNNDAELLQELKEKEAALLRARAYGLKKIGMTVEDLEIKPFCKKCSDTGFLPNGKACDCYQKEKEKDK